MVTMMSNDKRTEQGYKLDDEELAVLKATEAGEYEPIPDLQQKMRAFQQAAKAFTQLKRKPVTIRIPEDNLTRIRTQANKRGLPSRR
jgi:predicted DNA binding CopG/RHH family protein